MFKGYVWGSAVTFLVLLAALPVNAAKGGLAQLDDKELDKISAAGEPKVLLAEATGTAGVASVVNSDEAVFSLFIPENAQKGLRALSVANVVGEIQLLVNLNVLSAANNVAGTDQRNFSVQSWGATMPFFASEPGAAAIVGNPACITDCSSSGGLAIASPGIVVGGSASGDVIIQAKGGTSATVIHNEEPVFSLAFQSFAQVDLASLFIANVVGRAQAAYNINIAAATLNLVPSPETPFATPFQNAGPGVVKQVNSGVQFRGTPLGVGNTAAVVSIQHIPN